MGKRQARSGQKDGNPLGPSIVISSCDEFVIRSTAASTRVDVYLKAWGSCRPRTFRVADLLGQRKIKELPLSSSRRTKGSPILVDSIAVDRRK